MSERELLDLADGVAGQGIDFILAELADPSWSGGRFSWESFVPEFFRERWGELPRADRLVTYTMAALAAERSSR